MESRAAEAFTDDGGADHMTGQGWQKEAEEVEEIGAPTPHAAAPAVASKMICLRSLRAGNVTVPPSSAPSLGRWGACSGGSGGVEAAGLSKAGHGCSPSPDAVGERSNAASCEVPMAARKLVDLRQVKKVKSGPLPPGPAGPASSTDEASAFISSEGSVKVDMSAAKRMIKF